MVVNLLDVQPNIVTPELSNKIWLFYGEMGTRKTSIACSFPNHILFAYDIGYKFINGAMPVPMQTWADFKMAVQQLDKPEVKEKYKVAVIDTIGMAYTACYTYMLTQMGVRDPSEVPFGMGWKKIRTEFETVLRSICQKGYGLIMLAHSDEVEKEDKVSKEKVLAVKIDTDKRPQLIIKALADFVFYLHKEVKDGTDNELTVYAYSNLEDIDTKSRARFFSERFEFTYENLQFEMDQAIRKLYESENKTIPTQVEYKNPYAPEEVNFNQLLDTTINTAKLLIENGYEIEVNELLLNVFAGQRLSEVKETEDSINKLQVVLTSLIDLKTKAKL